MSIRFQSIFQASVGLASFCILGCFRANQYDLESTGKNLFFRSSKSSNLDFSDSLIEKVILSIPVEPGSREYFEHMVYSARASLSENIGNGKNQLFIGSDGSRCAHSFVLNREKRFLLVTEHCDNAIPPFVTKYYLYHANDGWIKSDRVLSQHEVKMIRLNSLETDYWDGVGG